MMNTNKTGGTPERLVLEFLHRVWGPSHELDAIDELMTEDYTITTAGNRISGRNAFKEWVRMFQEKLLDSSTINQAIFSNSDGDRVVSRWICSGKNNGLFGLAPDNRKISFTGIAIWRIRDGKLAECWVERSVPNL